MGASEGKTKEGRKLIRTYQKKHKSLTQSKDARHMTRLFNLYGGKKGYLDINEAKTFVKDVLIVCELLDELEDTDKVINGIVKELDPNGTNKVYISELLKPSWGKVQDVIHKVAGKMNQLTLSRAAVNNAAIISAAPVVIQPNIILPGAMIIKNEDSSLSLSDLEENCPPSFICPISTELMTDPVMLLETGTTYERKCIQEWLQHHANDPSTGLVLKSKEIVGVLALKNAIEEWTEDMQVKQKERKEKQNRKLNSTQQLSETMGSNMKSSSGATGSEQQPPPEIIISNPLNPGRLSLSNQVFEREESSSESLQDNQ